MSINNEIILYKKDIKDKRKRSDCFDWAIGVNVLTGAIPLLADTGTFGCSVIPSDPIRASLINLDLSDSSNRPILMPVLVRTPDRHTHKSKSESQSQAIHLFKPPRSRITGTRHAPSNTFRTCFKIDFYYLSFDIDKYDGILID